MFGKMFEGIHWKKCVSQNIIFFVKMLETDILWETKLEAATAW